MVRYVRLTAHKSGPSFKASRKIADAWEEQKAIKEVMLFLQAEEISTSIAVHPQEVRLPLDLDREEPALPAGLRRLGHRLPHHRQDRPVCRHPARQPGAR